MVRRLLPVAGLLALVALAPEPVLVGGLRLAAYAIVVTGASLLVARVGAADLALAAVTAVGAYAGGVGSALVELPVVLGLPLGAVAGALVGAASGAVHGRLGRAMGALASLAFALGIVAAVAAWPEGGGVAGFHAVALPTPWGARADLLVLAAVLLAALALASVVARTRAAALAALAVRGPQVVLAHGRRPAAATARIGAAAGALCGLGGVALATVTGSVMPDAFGLDLAAAIVLAALVGGAAPWGPLAGTALVWGPSTLWPLVPLVGTAPPLLLAGPIGLAVLAVRRGRPLLPARPATTAMTATTATTGERATAPASPRAQDDGELPGHRAPAPRRRLDLEVRDLDVLGAPVSLVVAAGEVVALVGPNGAGKSTLLARVAGQLDDDGAVWLGGARAPRGVLARARAGLARTWQRAPDLPAADVLALTAQDGDSTRAAGWARHVLGADVTDPGVAQLVLLASRRPGLVLLDEPTDVEPHALASFVGGLAQAGVGVLVVDHRPEVVALADRVVRLGGDE